MKFIHAYIKKKNIYFLVVTMEMFVFGILEITGAYNAFQTQWISSIPRSL